MNLRNLERVLAREEEVKRRAIVHKSVYNGPQIQYISKNGRFLYDVVFGHALHSTYILTLLILVVDVIFHLTIVNFPGRTYLEFIKGSSFHSEISTGPVQCEFL